MLLNTVSMEFINLVKYLFDHHKQNIFMSSFFSVLDSFECSKLLKIQDLYGRNSDKNDGLIQFLVQTQQEPHFDPTNETNDNGYNYPMIPFCGFGGPLNWLGKVNFTAVKGFNIYETQYTDLDPSKLMKWCHVFKPTFPLNYGNCLTTKIELPEVDQVGPYNGFAMVLENYFGQNSLKKGVVSHKLYIHEQDVLPDRFKIYEEGIDILYGKKHDISLTASIFNSTSNFNELDFKERECLLAREQKVDQKDRSFVRYAVSNCMMEKLVKLGHDICNCTSWDMALFLNRTDDRVWKYEIHHFYNVPQSLLLHLQICMNFERICLEKVFKNATSYKKILEKCPKPCYSILYSISSFKTSNLYEE